MKYYLHKPLREPWNDWREIRLLTLQPGSSSDDIQIKVSRRVISAELMTDDNLVSARSGPAWECLSYTWGNMEDSKTIYVEHDDPTYGGIASFEVGLNLFAALQQLRYCDRERLLWIDAICIDQSGTPQSIKEKSHQIPAMLEIYQLSSAVVIWLGEASEDSDLAMGFLQQLGESFEYDWTTYGMFSTSKLRPSTIELLNHWDSRFAWTTPEHRALCNLFSRDWFKRVWTRQEAFAGSSSSVVMCGSTIVPLSVFRNAIQLLGVKGLDVRDPGNEENLANLGRAIAVLEKNSQSYSTILDLMSKIRGGKCKEPQDKIYGCLGMIKLIVNPAFARSIPTDYPPTVELFKHFFSLYFKRYNTLRLLESGGLCLQSSLGGPSWLPDWTADITLLDQRMDCAVSHGMVSEAEYDGGDVLKVMGVIAATVGEVDTLKHTGDLSSDNFGNSYAELERLMKAHLDSGKKYQLEAFVRALTVPLNGLRVPPDQIERRRGVYVSLAQRVMETGHLKQATNTVRRESEHDFEVCIRYLHQRHIPFIFTNDGHVGISSIGAQPGDSITAVLGTNNLLLLRPAPGGQYQLVGSCSVHGLNWGETLLGALPSNFTVVPWVNPAIGNILPYYKNMESGEVSFWDPRIEWDELEVKPTDGPSYKIKAPPGEPERHVPTSGYFRRLGADLVQIELI